MPALPLKIPQRQPRPTEPRRPTQADARVRAQLVARRKQGAVSPQPRPPQILCKSPTTTSRQSSLRERRNRPVQLYDIAQEGLVIESLLVEAEGELTPELEE